ncbi:sigma-70 family RNA polymerase sigma factor [Streptomyces sp. TRM43335]|uniref:Sigma-70 family RNA polymerase sigma factor n=1 Tax=Streptomyces taklimakanensis TaxID=2569853 RepID=A0A6G2B854_9ACTN|nr:sigma-70 family RNA polymerase sigma factor [Streptomyces taklimakanensis]MTE18249.1 sigma-70 family RNA polymerase sigma factor [Streptomyces taklimakanensis]
MRSLLTAECAAEAVGQGVEPADLEQAVWLRWLERGRTLGPPSRPAAWLRAAVRAEVRSARRRARRETVYDPDAADGVGALGSAESAESRALRAERHRVLRAAVGRLPGRCPDVLAVLLSHRDLTYPEMARELGISQGSLGPVRSRCIDCLRRMLTTEVAPPGPRGRVR